MQSYFFFVAVWTRWRRARQVTQPSARCVNHGAGPGWLICTAPTQVWRARKGHFVESRSHREAKPNASQPPGAAWRLGVQMGSDTRDQMGSLCPPLPKSRFDFLGVVGHEFCSEESKVSTSTPWRLTFDRITALLGYDSKTRDVNDVLMAAWRCPERMARLIPAPTQHTGWKLSRQNLGHYLNCAKAFGSREECGLEHALVLLLAGPIQIDSLVCKPLPHVLAVPGRRDQSVPQPETAGTRTNLQRFFVHGYNPHSWSQWPGTSSGSAPGKVATTSPQFWASPFPFWPWQGAGGLVHNESTMGGIQNGA
jgi:hypothetical protein